MTFQRRVDSLLRLVMALINAQAKCQWLKTFFFSAQLCEKYAHKAWCFRVAQDCFERDVRTQAKRCAVGTFACVVIAISLHFGAGYHEKLNLAQVSTFQLKAPTFPISVLPVSNFNMYEGYELFDSEIHVVSSSTDANRPFISDLHDIDPLLVVFMTGIIFFSLIATHRYLQIAVGSLQAWQIASLSTKLAKAKARTTRARTAWSSKVRAVRRIGLALRLRP